MTQDEIKADLVRRVSNAVTDLRHEWASAGHEVAIEFDETATGVTVSIIAKVAPSPKDKNPLGKRKLDE
jgi:hypothetical protein